MEPKLFLSSENSKGKILILANEIYPQVCIGGLGMFVAGISKGLKRKGWEVAVFTPQNQNPVYLPPSSRENQLRSQKLAEKALAWCRKRSWLPSWVWVQDWEGVYQMEIWSKKAKIIWTIHSPISANGKKGDYYYSEVGVNDEPVNWGDDFFDFSSLIERGVSQADLITTVSPTYAKELSDIPPFSDAEEIVGINNGIDKEKWEPSKDFLLSFKLKKNWREFKTVNKKILQEAFGLPQKEVPLYTYVSRLVPQKGIDLIVQTLPSFLAKNDVQFIVVGQGLKRYHRFFQNLKMEFPLQVGLCLKADFSLPHQVFAGADFLLLPSLTEPFGIVVAEARQYGVVPIVRKVGGLDDQVKNGVNGFSFYKKKNDAFLEKLYQSSRFWGTCQRWEMSFSGRKLSKDWCDVMRKYEPYLLETN